MLPSKSDSIGLRKLTRRATLLRRAATRGDMDCGGGDDGNKHVVDLRNETRVDGGRSFFLPKQRSIRFRSGSHVFFMRS